jgi:hypothetical protein
VVLLPTAYTHTKGTFFFSSYDIVLLQGGYAFTDDTQITLTTLPLASEGLAILDLSLKSSLARGQRVRAAALASASGAVGSDIGALFIGRVGAVVQVCADAACDSSFSLSSNVALAGPLLLMANGLGTIWRVSRRVSLLGELATMVPLGTVGGTFNGATLGGGVRFHFYYWGFDLTLVRGLDTGGPALPLLSATYRTR